MEFEELFRSISPTATVKDLTAGGNRVYRLREESGESSIVKIYKATSRERRERHALEALEGVVGVPRILSRGTTSDGDAWIQMTDGGTWDLGTLPRNLDIVRSAGRVLRGVHESNAQITNLANTIDDESIASHYASTLDRLERFRRRIGFSQELLDAARTAGAPHASPARPAHTHPTPEQFLVTEAGQVTLIDWEWATMAPPEWDVSLASWQLANLQGDQASAAFVEGYGAAVSASRLRPWIAYHAAMMMLHAAENRDGRLHDLASLVRAMADSVGYS
jgi:aminoglycoside phosphotransferase (APT) family kinase protein